jgi:Uma2 family endonuclease
MEVPDSSLAHDRVEKGALYAEAGVPEYWIIDAAHERIEVRSDIAEGACSRVTPYRRGEVVRSLSLPDLEIAVDQIFG